MKLKKFQEQQAEWQEANFPDTTSTEIRHSSDKIERLKKDAVGDIVVYLAAYCNLEGLDLEECIESAWKESGHRDWVTNTKDGS